MSITKKISALALAAVMVLTLVGGMTVQSALAANPSTLTITNKSVSSDSFKVGDTVTRIELFVEDIKQGIGQNPVTGITGNTSIEIDTGKDSHFTGGSIQIADIVKTTTAPNYAKYKVVVLNSTVKSPGTTLKFTVKETKDGKEIYNQTVEVPISGFDDGSSSGGSSEPEPPKVDDSVRYSVTKVRQTQRVGSTDQPAERPSFDIDNISGGSDATIRQTYFADIVVKITDSNIPAGLSSTAILKGASKKDFGSFVFDSAVNGCAVAEKPSVDGYWEIKFTAVRYSGNDKKLIFRIDGTGTDGTPYIKDVSLDISECMTRKEAQAENDKNNNSDNDSGSRLEVETPYVIVNKYGYGGGNVTAGETFTLSMTFLNTSEGEPISNMMITLTMPEDLMLTSSSNTFYVPELKEKGSITKAVQVTAKPAAKAQSHNITVAMKYQYVDNRLNTRKDATTTETIAIPVVQVDRFQVTAVDIPSEVMMEEETSVTVTYVNKGRSDVFNLTASIEGNILNPGQNQNMGNLTSGSTGSADFFVKPSETGQLSGVITIVYEDNNMEEKTATINYNTTVKSMEDMMGGGGMFPGDMVPGMGEGEVTPTEEKSKLPVYIIIGVAVLIPVAVVVKKRFDKKRREREDADL